MYVTIDKTNCKFLRKHPDVNMLCNLAYIETPHLAVSIQPCDDHTFLNECTDLELKLLYKNTTGNDQVYFGSKLRYVLAELVSRLPVLDADKWELEYQANAIPEGNVTPYTYVKGSYKPAILPDLFAGFETPAAPDEALIVAQGKKLFTTLYPESSKPLAAILSTVNTPAGTTAAAKPAASPVPPKNPQAIPQKRGTVRVLIWDIADKEWERLGQPKDVKQVLEMRKNLYSVLANEHGIGKNTSSNELGAWQKSKQIF